MKIKPIFVSTVLLCAAVRADEPNATLGAFITPADATASSSQSGAGRTPRKTVDGSGWDESAPGSAVWVHSSNIWDGNNMWNGEWNSWLQYDLGKPYSVAGFYAWNYNEPGWINRGIKELTLTASHDGTTFVAVGDFTLEEATGKDDYKGQAVKFDKPVTARYFKLQIKSNYRGGEQSGLAEIRFANASVAAPAPRKIVWTPKYARPVHPKRTPGAIFPADVGVIDVTQAPYSAKGDGITDEQGPCFIKNVLVRGFDYGVKTATTVNGETLEHVSVEHQNKAGFRNDGQPFTARGLKSLNDVPAFLALGGLNVLIDCEFKGIGAAETQPAILLEGTMLARNIKTTGYAKALENKSGDRRGVNGTNVDFFVSKAPANLFGGATKSLNLPIKETPVVPWDALENWKAPQAFGAKTDDSQDDSAAIQQAIDSGASTVYLPRGGYNIGDTIVIRGKVRRLIGCRAWLEMTEALRKSGKPAFRFEDGAAPVVIVEGMCTDFGGGTHCFIEKKAKRTLVLHRLAINYQGADAYRGHGSGEVFIEDVVGHNFRFKGEKLWARQFNVEGGGVHISNDGGTQWILGYKTEGGGTLHQTTNGGVTEILGGMAYSSGQDLTTPMFIVENSKATFSFCEIDFGGGHFNTAALFLHLGERRYHTLNEIFHTQGSSSAMIAGAVKVEGELPSAQTNVQAVRPSPHQEYPHRLIRPLYEARARKTTANPCHHEKPIPPRRCNLRTFSRTRVLPCGGAGADRG